VSFRDVDHAGLTVPVVPIPGIELFADRCSQTALSTGLGSDVDEVGKPRSMCFDLRIGHAVLGARPPVERGTADDSPMFAIPLVGSMVNCRDLSGYRVGPTTARDTKPDHPALTQSQIPLPT